MIVNWPTVLVFCLSIGCSDSGFTGASPGKARASKKSENSGSSDAKNEADTDSDVSNDNGKVGDKNDTDSANASNDGANNGTDSAGSKNNDDFDPTTDSDVSVSKPGVEFQDEDLFVRKIKIGKIEISSVIDHISRLVVTEKEIYFQHSLLGFPADTQIKLWDTKGNLIDTKSWKPAFKAGQGPNCPSADYCTNACDCHSNKILFDEPTALTGAVSQEKGRGFIQGGKNGTSIEVNVWDCGDDCNSPDPDAPGKLLGADTYDWTIQ